MKYPYIITWSYSDKTGVRRALGTRNKDWKFDGAWIMMSLDDNYDVTILPVLSSKDAKLHSDELNRAFGIHPYEVKPGWYWWGFTTHRLGRIENNDLFGEETAQTAFEKFKEIYSDIDDKLINFNLKTVE